jgi:hypothetical protein
MQLVRVDKFINKGFFFLKRKSIQQGATFHYFSKPKIRYKLQFTRDKPKASNRSADITPYKENYKGKLVPKQQSQHYYNRTSKRKYE